MAEVQIAEAHKVPLARLQYALEFLLGERARLEVEKQHVERQGERVQREMLAMIQRDYGIEAVSGIDSERGVIVTPDAPAPAPTVADVLKADEPEPAEAP